MRFYGIQPSEIALLTSREQHALSDNIPRMQALESLRYIADAGVTRMGEEGAASEYTRTLVDQAYGNHKDYLVILESVTRKNGIQ